MTDAQSIGLSLLLIGGLVLLVFLANYNMPGNGALPGRRTNPVGYWGNVAFFAGMAVLGLYGLVIGLTA